MKCTYCNAPVAFNDRGEKRFDSSRYHMDAAKKLSRISCLTGQVEELRAAMQEFVDRCDRGEILSKRTYARFKELLSD